MLSYWQRFQNLSASSVGQTAVTLSMSDTIYDVNSSLFTFLTLLHWGHGKKSHGWWDGSVQGSPFSVYLFILTLPHLTCVNKAEAFVASEGYHFDSINNNTVNMIKRLQRNIRYYAANGVIRGRGQTMWLVSVASVWYDKTYLFTIWKSIIMFETNSSTTKTDGTKRSLIPKSHYFVFPAGTMHWGKIRNEELQN
jgi:hypothetical protein